MTVRKPIVVVEGPKTANLVAVWGDTLLSVHIHDATAHDSDSCTLVFSTAPPFPPLPPKGTRYVVSVGWSAAAMAMTGIYTVQRSTIAGDPESGHTITVECRAADLADKAKTVDSAHWDDTTLGAIVDDIASKMGMTAVIDPEMRSIAIPYRARIDQEALDFLSDLGDDFGGAVKIAGDKVVMTKRGSGRSASGADLATITVVYAPSYAFSFEFEPRGDDAESSASWWDDETGTWIDETDEGSGKGRLAGPHPWPSKGEAKLGARARRGERKRKAATGSIEVPGDPSAVAGCPVVASGYGPDADGTAWIAESIDHEIVPESGWIMTFNLETKDGKKGGED
jgi:phage protein D